MPRTRRDYPGQNHYVSDQHGLLIGGPVHEAGKEAVSSLPHVTVVEVLPPYPDPRVWDPGHNPSVNQLCRKVNYIPLEIVVTDVHGEGWHRKITFFVPATGTKPEQHNFIFNQLMGAYRELTELKRDHGEDYDDFRAALQLPPS